MKPADLQRLKEAFNKWASTHPAPDVPALGTSEGTFTPRELAQALQDETKIGKSLIQMFDLVISSGVATIDQVVADFTQIPPPKP